MKNLIIAAAAIFAAWYFIKKKEGIENPVSGLWSGVTGASSIFSTAASSSTSSTIPTSTSTISRPGDSGSRDTSTPSADSTTIGTIGNDGTVIAASFSKITNRRLISN